MKRGLSKFKLKERYKRKLSVFFMYIFLSTVCGSSGSENAILFTLPNINLYQMSINGSGVAVKEMSKNVLYFDYDPISNHIFYVQFLGEQLTMSHADGTHQKHLAHIVSSMGISVDWLERRVFVDDAVRRVIINFNIKTLKEDNQIRANDSEVMKISLDIFHSVLYWNAMTEKDEFIFRSAYNGENREIILQRFRSRCISALAVDYRHEDIYFSCAFGIYRMKSNGSNQALFMKTVGFVSVIVIQGDYQFTAVNEVIKRMNKYTGQNQILYTSDQRVYDLHPFYIRSDSDYVGYDDLRCQEIARCFGINNTWICLQSDMICDGNPQCHGELDEFYCCYDNSYNCSSIHELRLVCNKSGERATSEQESQDFVGWKNSTFFNIFGSSFLSFQCSLWMKYLDLKHSLEKNIKINHIQRYHILRQFMGPTILRNFENSETVTLSGQIPSIRKDAFKHFSRLNKLVLKNTNVERIGNYLPYQKQDEEKQSHLEKLRKSVVYQDAFKGLNNVRHLTISDNEFLTNIDNNAFNGLDNLRTLEIRGNENLQTIKANAFNGVSKLSILNISENSDLLNEYVFTDLTTVKHFILSRRFPNKLTLTGNIPSLKEGDFYSDTIKELMLLKTNIRQVTGFFFGGIENLELLSLAENRFLSGINKNAFNGIRSLVYLKISGNPHLSGIEKDSFAGLESLTNLSIINSPKLFRNMYIASNFFDNVWNIKMLNISGNNLVNLEDGLLDNLTNLEVIDLRQNSLKPATNIFRKNKKLTHIYSDTYSFCCLYLGSDKNEYCFAPKDDVSSCNELIADRKLVSLLWIIGIIAFFGNISVLLYRFLRNRESLKQTFSVLVINLSCSDAIMGLYMLIIAYHDNSFEGEYVLYDYDWKQSFACKMEGTLAFISSESSVIFISLITIDRLLAVKYPIGNKRFKLRHALLLSILAWITSVFLAVIPVLIYPQFYSYSGTCLALPLTGNFNPGWQISVAIFLGFNCFLFVLITIGQISILRMIIQSARSAGTKHSNNEREAAVFLSMVAFTDALCWIPVGILVMMAISGKTISREIYAWIIIFVLPVNSAVNPFLYTFAPLCRKKQKELKTATVQSPAAGH